MPLIGSAGDFNAGDGGAKGRGREASKEEANTSRRPRERTQSGAIGSRCAVILTARLKPCPYKSNREKNVRIISARKATRRERRHYEEEAEG